MNIFLTILLIYLIQVFITSIINAINCSRIPKGFKDFLKLTFLPWLLFNLKNARKKLE